MIKIVAPSEKNNFNKLAFHPLQSWEWGEFRLKTGIEVIRLGRYENNKLTETAQITVHPIPFTAYKIGYFPKGGIISNEMLIELVNIGKKEKMIFIKLEPNVNSDPAAAKAMAGGQVFRSPDFQKNLVFSPHPLFTQYTFLLDLTKSEEELLKNMHHKTRYNIKLAEKKGVKIIEDDSENAFNKYLKLTKETTIRQKFFAHTEEYHRLMWETLKPSGIARLFLAKYKENGKEEILAAWILFNFNNVLYYPYGASSTLYRNLMASNLMMWTAIKFGKKQGCKLFDMWGALGPEPSPSDSWYGFHKFKEGYGATLTELIGSFDLIINPALYNLYNLVHYFREIYLKIIR